MFFGTLLIIIGLGVLLQNLGLIPGDVWGIIWPLALIALGLSMIGKRQGRGWHMPWCHCADCTKPE